MARLTRLMAIISLIMMMGIGITQAQSNPLLIVMDGQIYSWSGDAGRAVSPYSACNHSERIVSGLARSARGTLAFLTEPVEVSDVIQQFGGAGGALPNNVRICDGNSITGVATQPDDFSYFTNEPNIAVAHSAPTWSPNGMQLAWTTVDFQSGVLTLDTYDLTTRETIQTPLDLPPFTGEILPPYITWKDSGIFLFHATTDPETFGFIEYVFLFDGLGNQMFDEVLLPSSDESRFIYDKFVVTDQGREFVGLMYNDGSWDLVDPSTGDVQPADGTGEMFSPANSDGISLLLTVDESQQYVWKAKNEFGVIVDVNGNEVAVPGLFPTATALSSNGVWVFQLFDGLYFWSMGASGYINGTEAVTTGFSALTWSDNEWRIDHNT